MLLINIPLSAVDVSNFDIKGIKLGMSKSQVLKKMPCSNPEINIERLRSGKISNTYIKCSSNYFQATLDHNNYVYSVSMSIDFNTEPNFKKIKNKILKKYKRPNKNPKMKVITRGSGERVAFCWGKDCRTSVMNNGVWKGREISNYIKGKSLQIEYINYYIKGNHNELRFELVDANRKNNDYKWSENQETLYNRQQKEKVSNIDF
jgi:hypothetical protein